MAENLEINYILVLLFCTDMFQELYIELSSYFWPQEGVVVIITSRPVKKTSHVRQLFERGKMQEGYGEKCIFVLTMLLQLLGR